MRRWAGFFALLLVACWLPASSHCLLEMAGCIQPDTDCHEPAAEHGPPTDHSACGACQVEAGRVLPAKPDPSLAPDGMLFIGAANPDCFIRLLALRPSASPAWAGPMPPPPLLPYLRDLARRIPARGPKPVA